MIRITVIIGLVVAMVSPANAEHSDLEFAVRVGPATVQYNGAYRRYSGYRHYDRDYRHWRNHKKRHHKQRHRQKNVHYRWHWNNDGRWDRYYFYDHADLHHELRHGHRDLHRRNNRHR